MGTHIKTHANIRDVARLAGVSTATVSRTLSNPDAVLGSTRDQVLTAISELNYLPDASARALSLGRTHTVGCVVPTLDNAAFALMTQTLQTALAAAGYQVLLAGHEYRPDAEFKLSMALLQRGVDAIVLVGAEHSPTLWAALRDWGKPALLTWVCDTRLPSIGIDNEAAGFTAAQHLLNLGHTRIGVISGTTLHNDRARLRVHGVRLALAQAGLKLLPDMLSEQPFGFEGGSAGLRTLMAARWPPSAIFCSNDLLAAGALLEAHRMGLKVPQQLSICGFDDMALAGALNPGLTTIRVPIQEMGLRGARAVLSMLADEHITQQTLLPFELVVRGSTAPPQHGRGKLAPAQKKLKKTGAATR